MFNSAELIAAINNKDLKKIKLWIKKNANINAQDEEGNTILHYATYNNNLNVVEYLVKKGANINIQNNDGHSALHFAAKHGNANITKFLLKNNANIDIQNNDGHSAFMSIQEMIMKNILVNTYFSFELDSILTSFPQFLNQQNRFGDSPLMTQIRSRNISMIKCLLSKILILLYKMKIMIQHLVSALFFFLKQLNYINFSLILK